MIQLVLDEASVFGIVKMKAQDGKAAILILSKADLLPFKKQMIFPPAKGTWWKDNDGQPMLGCMNCGGLTTISKEGPHTVEPDGAISPSFICLHKGCGFHAWIRLEDYAKPKE